MNILAVYMVHWAISNGLCLCAVPCCVCISFAFGKIQNLLRLLRLSDCQSRRMWKLVVNNTCPQKKPRVSKLSRFTEGRMSLLDIGRNLDKSQIAFEKKLSFSNYTQVLIRMMPMKQPQERRNDRALGLVYEFSNILSQAHTR